MVVVKSPRENARCARNHGHANLVGQTRPTENAMAETVNIYEAKTQLSKLVDRAANGEEIIIARSGRPVARLVALKPERPRRRPGRMRGHMWIGPDFDDPLPDDLFDGDDEL